MSAINYHCDEFVWAEIVPGIWLVEAKNIVKASGPYDISIVTIPGFVIGMEEGWFGLTISNDPFTAFEKPVKVKDVFKQADRWSAFQEALIGDVNDMGRLYEACKKAGWDRKKHGFVHVWLFNRIATLLARRKKPKVIYESMDKLSKKKKTK